MPQSRTTPIRTRLNTYTAYGIGCAAVWAVILVVTQSRTDSQTRNTISPADHEIAAYLTASAPEGTPRRANNSHASIERASRRPLESAFASEGTMRDRGACSPQADEQRHEGGKRKWLRRPSALIWTKASSPRPRPLAVPPCNAITRATSTRRLHWCNPAAPSCCRERGPDYLFVPREVRGQTPLATKATHSGSPPARVLDRSISSSQPPRSRFCSVAAGAVGSRVLLRAAVDRKQKSGLAGAVPVRWLGLRETRSEDAVRYAPGPPQTRRWARGCPRLLH
jgi:hypothetical protein